jgi:GNAT superfamily N-acetyltransferase
MKIIFAETDEQILSCFEAVQALRPHITDPAAFLQQVKEMGPEGYRILYCGVEEDGKEKAAAFVGFRPMYKLFSGRSIYIDDLSTLPAYRGRGYGAQLLDRVHQIAKETGKNVVDLDSGFQRHDAHRLYLNRGYTLSCHHFTYRVPPME